jgi:hypothetical protein
VKQLATLLKEKHLLDQIQLVISSPLTRALQVLYPVSCFRLYSHPTPTKQTLDAFKASNIRIEINPLVREAMHNFCDGCFVPCQHFRANYR